MLVIAAVLTGGWPGSAGSPVHRPSRSLPTEPFPPRLHKARRALGAARAGRGWPQCRGRLPVPATAALTAVPADHPKHGRATGGVGRTRDTGAAGRGRLSRKPPLARPSVARYVGVVRFSPGCPIQAKSGQPLYKSMIHYHCAKIIFSSLPGDIPATPWPPAKVADPSLKKRG
jgi:hypothetical protein